MEAAQTAAVDCPACGRSVLAQHINQHLDSGCAEHCLPAAVPAAAAHAGENEPPSNHPHHVSGTTPLKHKRRSRSSSSASAHHPPVLLSPRQRHHELAISKSATATPSGQMTSPILSAVEVHELDDDDDDDANAVVLMPGGTINEDKKATVAHLGSGATDSNFGGGSSQPPTETMPGAIYTPPTERRVAPSASIIRSAPLLPDNELPQTPPPRTRIERTYSKESDAFENGELRPSHDLKIDLARNVEDVATQTASSSVYNAIDDDTDTDFPLSLLPSHNLNPVDMMLDDMGNDLMMMEQDLFQPVGPAVSGTDDEKHAAAKRRQGKSTARHRKVSRPPLPLAKTTKAFEQSTLGRRQLQASAEELNRVSQELVASGSMPRMNVRQTKYLQRLDIENKRAKLGYFQRKVYDLAKRLKKWQVEAAKKSGIWSQHLRYIESRFGSGIVSYFVLFRWIFMLDAALSAVWLMFVITFGMIGMGEDEARGVHSFLHASFTGNASAALYYGQPGFVVPRNANASSAAIIGGLFTGGAGYPVSVFFYGGYKRSVLNGTYMADAAYLSVIAAFFLISFVLIMRRIRKLFVSRAEVSGTINVDEVSPFGTTAFAAWDFSIMARETGENHSYAISTVFKTLLSRLEVKDKKVHISKDEEMKNYLRRFFGHLAVLTTLAVAGLIVSATFCIDNSSSGLSESSYCVMSTQALKGDWTDRIGFSLSAFAISFFNFTLPFLFSAIAAYENYSNPEVAQNITLARSFVLKISSIYIILADFHFNQRYKLTNWENVFGKQFYELVWVNSGFTIVSTLAYGFLTKWWRGREKYDFGLSNNILEVIYRQAIIWIGSIYAPMLLIVSLLSGWVIFFAKKFALERCGLPPRRIYNSYTQNIYFQFFLLFTLGLMVLPIGWMLTQYPPSCGPFGPFGEPFGQGKQLWSAYAIIPESVSTFPEFARNIANFIGSLAFVIMMVAVLGIWIYYLLAVGHKRQKQLKQLQYEVAIERADKRFLLRYYKVKT